MEEIEIAEEVVAEQPEKKPEVYAFPVGIPATPDNSCWLDRAYKAA